MRIFNLVLFLFGTLAVTVAIIFQFFKIETEETQQLSSTIEQVFQIKQLDIKLNEEALKASSFKLIHFDGIVQSIKNLNEARKTAAHQITQIQPLTQTPLGELLTNLNQEISERLKNIERLKAKVALARNSNNFLLAAVRKYTHQNGIANSALALRALNEVQGYHLFQTPERFENTQSILKLLRQQAETAGDKELKIVLRHMEVSFFATQDVSALLNNMFASNSQKAVDSLLFTLNKIQVHRQNMSNGNRYLLLGVAIIIFIVLAYVFIRWNQARTKSQQVSELFQDAAESMPEGFAFFNPKQKLAFWNSTFEKIYSPLGKRLKKGMSLNEFKNAQEEVNLLEKTEPQADGSTLDFFKNGRWVLSSNTDMKQGGQTLVRVDLTDQKNAQEQLLLSAAVFQTASEGMMVTDANDTIKMINPAFSAITGYSEEDVLGKTPQILSSGHHDKSYYEKMFLALQRNGIWQGEIWNRRKNGEVYPEWLSITTIYDDEGNVKQRVSLFTDITSRKKSEERIHHQANYDSLTDLPNRNLFIDRLSQSINHAKRNNQRIAMLFLDLDNFKHINDTLGHAVGDELLQHVSQRLCSEFRTSDTIARLSGDEFVIIINDVTRTYEIELVIQRLLENLSEPYQLNNHTTYTSASVGATFYPDDGQTVESLLQNADAAMFQAKEKGRNTFCFFTPEMNTRAQERHMLETALHGALKNEDFILHYQPIVDPVSQTVVSTECLVRWNDPERGLVPPDKFIPIAEDTGLIVPLGEWILRQACRDAAHWYHEKGIHIGVSVNLSSRQFTRGDILALVKEVLEETNLPANKLTLEITESVLVDDESDILQTLRQLRDLGVLLSIDDFGTGYSSLSYLKRFPITTLKIDRSFINEVLSNSEDAALTQAILSMAQSLNLKVVAEGVENAGQVAFLLERQCDLIQGYHYSKPIPVSDLLEAFEEKRLAA